MGKVKWVNCEGEGSKDMDSVQEALSGHTSADDGLPTSKFPVPHTLQWHSTLHPVRERHDK